MADRALVVPAVSAPVVLRIVMTPADLAGLEWQDKALCAQVDPEIFYPEKGGSVRAPKRICRACEVRAECLDYALTHGEKFGIWGGFTERERRRLAGRAGRMSILIPAIFAYDNGLIVESSEGGSS